jgi:hypothetical protein
MTRTQRIAAALARIPRSGSLHNDLRDEAAVLVKKLRPLLVDQRLGAVIRALLLLAAEYSSQLLRAEANGCDCTHDLANGLFRCTSNRQHAVNEIIAPEESQHVKRNKN